MDLPDDKVFYKDLSYKIIGLAMEVHGELGCGFLEKVYENALVYLLKEKGIKAEQQFPLKVMFLLLLVFLFCSNLVAQTQFSGEYPSLFFFRSIVNPFGFFPMSV